jgi:hypothetical protein
MLTSLTVNLSEVFDAVVPSVVAFIRTGRPGADGNPPLSPLIFATGFIVDPDGSVATNRHVVTAFKSIPKDPGTGKIAAAAMLPTKGFTDTGAPYRGWTLVPFVSSTFVDSIVTDARWSGESKPDIGFVQIKAKDLPSLKLAVGDGYVRTGMEIPTAGFPLGDTPLTALGKLNQWTPFLRRGIVSSAFPWDITQPHGFTIDIMQQGGSSGSAIFRADEPLVLGMMSQSVLEWSAAESDQVILHVAHNTNISIAVPAPAIQGALDGFRSQYPLDLSGIPTFAEHMSLRGKSEDFVWETA